MAKDRDGVSPYPEHCFDETGGSQFEPTHSCCWCGIAEQEWEKHKHGPLYKGSGKLVKHTGEECPERIRLQGLPAIPQRA